jgi:hypothetical protein
VPTSLPRIQVIKDEELSGALADAEPFLRSASASGAVHDLAVLGARSLRCAATDERLRRVTEGDPAVREWLVRELDVRLTRALRRDALASASEIAAAVMAAVGEAVQEVADGLDMTAAQRRADSADPAAAAAERAEARELSDAALGAARDE